MDFLAELNFYSTMEGGRHSIAFSGYRPHVKFDDIDFYTSGEQIYVTKGIVSPGEKGVMTRIRILTKEPFHKKLFVGKKFTFGEGQRIVGTGKIVEIYNDDLKNENTV
jgi:translation elongation factor EF-Tu-like GTPase